ncbi:hypothetical protein J437_LFUL017795 [Ladona fulva]|uniref:PiggyBac transposable element-derived protein domain-containing protein n=1 Tax=Ladona fulva TaxID=123851 RepID=A0A8K0KME7_LADFU|nr:hypothetical protein J437_LFUL017795 [Ladona fulva]
MDSWYSSPDLFQKLAKEKTNVLGTVHENRKNMPKVFKKMNLKKDLEMTKTGKLSFKTKEAVIKPKIVMDYNLQMNTVDR